MEQRPQENPAPTDRYRDAEAQLGGADDVEKTTYVVGRGTEPEARAKGPTATVSSGGAPRLVLGVVVVLVVLVALAYLIGLFG